MKCFTLILVVIFISTTALAQSTASDQVSLDSSEVNGPMQLQTSCVLCNAQSKHQSEVYLSDTSVTQTQHPTTQPGASDQSEHAVAATQAAEPKVKPYPLKYCIVMPDMEVDEDSWYIVMKGQQFRVCCSTCDFMIQKDPEKYLKALSEAVKKEQAKMVPTTQPSESNERDTTASTTQPATTKVKPYPLKYCIVMPDMEVDEDSWYIVEKGQQFRVCCSTCETMIQKDPDKYIKALAQAVKDQGSETKEPLEP